MLIAIVDDKPYLRNSLKEKLASIENEVTVIMEAGDGTDFIKLMKTASPQPDVVLMDIEMHELNGIETIQRAAPLYPAVKFIMLTVFDDDERIFNWIADKVRPLAACPGQKKSVLRQSKAEWEARLEGVERGQRPLAEREVQRLG